MLFVWTKIKNKNGFTLPEVLIASSIFLIVLVGISQMLVSTHQNISLLEGRLESGNLKQLLYTTLSNSQSCNRALGSHCSNPNFTDSAACTGGGGTWVNGVSLNFNGPSMLTGVRGANGQQWLQTNTHYSTSIYIESLSLVNKSPSDGGVPNSGGTGVAELVVEYRLTKVNGGSTTKGMSFPLLIDTIGSLPSSIATCRAPGGGELPNSATYMITSAGHSACPGETNCVHYEALCHTGDMLLTGDCFHLNGTDFMPMAITGLPDGTDCSGCPNGTPCPTVCRTTEMVGFRCKFYNGEQNFSSSPNKARAWCIDRS